MRKVDAERFAKSLVEGRKRMEVHAATPVPKGHVRLATVQEDARPLDVRPVHVTGRASVHYIGDGQSGHYVVSDLSSGMRLAQFYHGRIGTKAAARRVALHTAKRAAPLFDAAERGELAAVQALYELRCTSD